MTACRGFVFHARGLIYAATTLSGRWQRTRPFTSHVQAPTRAAYAGGSYAVTNSAVEAVSGEMLVEAAIWLLREMAREQVSAGRGEQDPNSSYCSLTVANGLDLHGFPW